MATFFVVDDSLFSPRSLLTLGCRGGKSSPSQSWVTFFSDRLFQRMNCPLQGPPRQRPTICSADVYCPGPGVAGHDPRAVGVFRGNLLQLKE